MRLVNLSRLAVLAAAAATCIVSAAPPSVAAASAVRTARSAASQAECADVLFVGARGSGQDGPGDHGWKPSGSDPYGLGGTVNSVYQRLAGDLGEVRSGHAESVAYAANGVQTLAHAPNQYFANLATGVNSALSILSSQARTCPAEQIVLAGFSQGAMVMHRVLHDLGATAAGRAILARVAAAVLVGDGDEVPHDYQTRYGTASTSARGIGQALRTISHSSAAEFSPSMTARVLSVCNNHDLVCGWTNLNLLCLTDPKSCLVSFTAMTLIHLSYANSKPLLAAADRAAALARDMPAPYPVTLTMHAATAISYQMRADIAAGFTLQWRVTPGAKLPPGLSLSSTGLITGVPQATGTYVTGVQVRSVRARLHSPWLPVTVTFTS